MICVAGRSIAVISPSGTVLSPPKSVSLLRHLAQAVNDKNISPLQRVCFEEQTKTSPQAEMNPNLRTALSTG